MVERERMIGKDEGMVGRSGGGEDEGMKGEGRE